MKLISRKEAKEKGLKRYFTGEPCKRGHMVERVVSNGRCAKCDRECKRQWYEENKERESERAKQRYEENKKYILERQRKYREENKDSISEYNRKYREGNKEAISYRNRQRYNNNPEYFRQYIEDNKELISDRKRRYYKKNREAIAERMSRWREKNKESQAERHRRYAANNPHRANARSSKYRASKLQRTLPGHDEDILAIYAEAAMRRANGEDVHVDHVIPLQGESISGLHVPWNLEIIPASENCSKSNRFAPIIEVYDQPA